MSSARAARPWVWFAALVFLALAWSWRFTCDDAFISFRYARHLVEGHGLRFNLGEDPPVEGFSNLLWVLVLAPFEAVHVSLEVVAQVLSAAAGVAALFLLRRILAARFTLEGWAEGLVLLFLALQPAFVVWASSGLETMPFALALLGLYERLELAPERRRGAIVWAAVAILLRVDGIAWVLLVVALQAIATRFGSSVSASSSERSDSESSQSPAGRPRTLISLALAALGIFAALTLWRWSYFHELLPNTARVKSGLSEMRLERGTKYILSFFLTAPACVLVPFATWSFARRPRTAVFLFASALVLAHFGYAVFVGGDFMAMGRFLVGAMPFEALLLAHLLANSSGLARPTLGSAACALSLAASLGVPFAPRAVHQRLHFRWNDTRWNSEREQWAGMRERAAQWKQLGRALASHTKPGESIVLGNIGAIGYESELQILDLFGLVAPEVAKLDQPPHPASPGHDKGVPPSFFFPRKPDYLAAWIAPANTSYEEQLPGGWNKLKGLPTLVYSRYALQASDGFEPGTELRLVSMRWPR